MEKKKKKKTAKQIKAEKQRKMIAIALGIVFAIFIVMMILNPPPLSRIIIIGSCAIGLFGAFYIGKRIGDKRKDRKF